MTPRCCGRDRRPVIPQSRNPMRPSESAIRFPACTSPWKNPWKTTHWNHARIPATSFSSTSMPSAVPETSFHARAVEALDHDQALGRVDDARRDDVGAIEVEHRAVELGHVRGLAGEVESLRERGREIVDHGDGVGQRPARR